MTVVGSERVESVLSSIIRIRTAKHIGRHRLSLAGGRFLVRLTRDTEFAPRPMIVRALVAELAMHRDSLEQLAPIEHQSATQELVLLIGVAKELRHGPRHQARPA